MEVYIFLWYNQHAAKINAASEPGLVSPVWQYAFKTPPKNDAFDWGGKKTRFNRGAKLGALHFHCRSISPGAESAPFGPP